MTQEQTRQTSGQAEDKRTSKEGRKRDKSRSKEDKKKGKHKSKRTRKRTRKRTKEDKIEANTPQASKPPNSTRAQKPHKPRKAPSPYKYTSAPQNPPKTPFKKRNRAYLKADAGDQKQQRDKGRAKGGEHGTKAGRATKANHLHSVDTTTCHKWTLPPPPQKRMKAAPRKPQTQNIFHFCPFWSPKIPRKHQSTPKKNSLLPLFAENLPRWTEN